MASPFQDAVKQMGLTPQEQNLYMHHLNNLQGPGKVEGIRDTSTVLQTPVLGPGGRYYNIPTVWNGQVLDSATASQMAAQAGWHNWPSYPTPQAADLRYERMHDYFERDLESYREARKPIGSFKRGGTVKKTGVYKVHKGEKVTPARNQTKDMPMRSRSRRPAVPRVRPRRRRIMPTLPVAPAPGPAMAPGAGAGAPMGGGLGGPPGAMPGMKKGGRVKRTGPHMLHKGEKVVPADQAKGMTKGKKKR